MTVLCVIGTRPEAIKMAPVVRELRARGIACRVLSTAQHRHMVDPLLQHFEVPADLDLDVMTENQNLATLTARILERFWAVLERDRPALVLAQGDTTTVFATALACFYARVPFGHVEAGLRTHDMASPFPEEFNRVAASHAAALHFAPTRRSADNLLAEGVAPERVHTTGNTVIDALLWTAERAGACPVAVPDDRRLMLVTVHRRENHGAPLRDIFGAIGDLLRANPELEILYPVHPNPNVQGVAQAMLGGHPRVHLTDPLPYPQLVAAMKRCDLILTDSGGIQEEAPSLGKPVLVVRETTERPEAVEEGVAELLGTDRARIVARVQRLLDDPAAYARMAEGGSPYGDGQAARRIVDAVADYLKRDHPGEGRIPVARSIAG